MICDRCQGLGTIVLKPATVRDENGEDLGAVIALCPACHGSGVKLSERRRPVRLKPAAPMRATRVQ